ncbi:MAG: hypothetical protein NVS9B1_26680 [Candidatus Dormibacteraceae bacterium]
MAALALFVMACASSPEVGVATPRPPDPTEPCRTATLKPVNAIFLAKEAVPDELAGLDYFVQTWGMRSKCFRGVVVTTLGGADPAQFDAVVVDVSHDQALTAADATALDGFRKAGKRIAIFGWPLRLDDLSTIADPLSGARQLLGNADFHLARGCGDWQFSEPLKFPFQVGGGSYRYENFGGAIFTVTAAGSQRALATTLFCPQDTGSVMVETKSGIVAGFSIAYSVSLADNNIRAVNLKQMLVDVLQLLVGPGPSG